MATLIWIIKSQNVFEWATFYGIFVRPFCISSFNNKVIGCVNSEKIEEFKAELNNQGRAFEDLQIITEKEYWDNWLKINSSET